MWLCLVREMLEPVWNHLYLQVPVVSSNCCKNILNRKFRFFEDMRLGEKTVRRDNCLKNNATTQ